MNVNLTGLRVIVQTGGETFYGVARVRYMEGHRNAGTYEVERKEQPPVLVPWESCLPGPNWDDTPEEGRFLGSQFYRPQFLDGTRRAYLSGSPGVIVPGDMDRLRQWIDVAKPGYRVRWESHGCNEFVGTLAIEATDDRGLRLTGPPDAPKHCTWPAEGDEFEVNGNALHFWRTPPKRTGKHPGRIRSLTIQPTSSY